MRLNRGYADDDLFLEAFASKGLTAFIVSIDPEQTYFPRIVSRVTENGSMVSNPLHLMTPMLTDEEVQELGKYL